MTVETSIAGLFQDPDRTDPFYLRDGETVLWVRHAPDGTAVVRVRNAERYESVFDVWVDPRESIDAAGFNFDAFVDGYVTAALWADCYPHGTPGENGMTQEEFDRLETGGGEGLTLRDGARASMIERGQLVDFVAGNLADLLAYCEARPTSTIYDESQGPAEAHAGHDFWLTRNGHGCGFWDRGLDALGDRLTEACKPYGSADDHTPYDCGDDTADV
jgi:hypothetical protein